MKTTLPFCARCLPPWNVFIKTRKEIYLMFLSLQYSSKLAIILVSPGIYFDNIADSLICAIRNIG